MWLLSTFLGAVLSLVGTSNGLDSCEERNGTLDFLFMTSFGGAFNSSGSALGMMMALERINANSTVLPDYKLGYTSIVDSQVSAASNPLVMYTFFIVIVVIIFQTVQ